MQLLGHPISARIVNVKVKKSYRYNIILRPEPEGGFTVSVPALPGCVTYGRDLAEAKMMAEDGIRGYLAVLRKRRQKIPSDRHVFMTALDISYAAVA